MKILRINAPAKVNLGLEVLSKRADGYHNINSIFTRVPLYDQLTFTESNDLELKCDIDLGIKAEENLVYKAAKLFIENYKISDGVSIELKKTIPSGAGLGGGSSDAAATLKGLPAFFNKKVSEETLFEIAKSLGSDVPYFLKDGSALVSGRGEELKHFDYKIPYYVQIVKPNFSVNTGEAYAGLPPRDEARQPLDYSKYIKYLKEFPYLFRMIFRNDFEHPKMNNYGEILYIRRKMKEAGAFFTSMTGSGSCVYGFYFNPSNISYTNKYFENYKVFFGKF